MANYSPKRGHLALKSNALNPTATSYEGQQLILNHMKSHYSRISRAKAAVDTSAPRSMKKHIRVQDQVKRELLRKSNEAHSEGKLTPRRRAQSASLENISNYDGHLSHHFRPHSSQGYHRASTPLDHSIPEPSSSMPRDITSAYQKSSKDQPRQEVNASRGIPYNSPRALPRPLVSHNRWRNVQNRNTIRQSSYDYDNDARDRQKPIAKDETNDDLQTETRDVAESLGGTQNDMVEDTQYRGDSRMSTRLHSHALDSSYGSHTSMSSAYARRKKEIQTKMWEQEQNYMQFISDVTSDVLARGIFSNRVLNKVFESHIDKRKDDLDESRMREMIDQLKLDLDIT
ncbi:spermatogenesis-associated protein 7 homolog [Actinia tenebrosa]|uniref:Spermatogenesis-associated protein 7 homolog n=1 Tax=Actinia tenebrosa TaxID=6105 RepID=A0A6P8HPZ1_ACTTE|nr:spermatogenesis-associated protein 7 homolog [Actinia tenebrosa]